MPADPLLTLDHSSPIVTIQSHLLAHQYADLIKKAKLKGKMR